LGVKSRINVALRAGAGATGAAAFVADVAGVEEDAPEPQPAAAAARRQAHALRARIAPSGRPRKYARISGARIGAPWT